MAIKKAAKKPLGVQEQQVLNMSRRQRRCLTVAKNLRARAAALVAEAERNEANAAGFGQVAAMLTKAGNK